MAKGLSQGAAWGLSIIFSVMLFTAIITMIMSIRPSSDMDETVIDASYEAMKSGKTREPEPKSKEEGVIRADDSSYVDPQEKKSEIGAIKVS